MKSLSLGKRWQRGVAAIELAGALPFLLVLLAYPVYMGRVFFHYTAAAKAAHDMATYMSSVPATDFITSAQIDNVIAVAKAIGTEELADLNTGGDAPYIEANCGDGSCVPGTVPTFVRGRVVMHVKDPLFSGLTQPLSGDDGIELKATIQVAYAGQ